MIRCLQLHHMRNRALLKGNKAYGNNHFLLAGQAPAARPAARADGKETMKKRTKFVIGTLCWVVIYTAFVLLLARQDHIVPPELTERVFDLAKWELGFLFGIKLTSD